MTPLEVGLAVVGVLLMGVTVKLLILNVALGIQIDRAQQRATRALVEVDVLKTRVLHLESVLFEDEEDSNSDYESPVLTPYGEQPGWKGGQDGAK